MPAVVFGRYQLLERLAVGGMAELFLARAQGEGGFEKVCVVKRVLPHLATDGSFVSMFLDEARLAARLEHPGITQIFDLGKIGEDYYLAMEYLPGEDAAAVLSKIVETKTSLPVPLVARLVADAAEALHYAHEHGVVHRDVSPANLFVTYRGQVKVLDFGIAHAAGRLGRTEPGQVKGKAAYMSPEQAKGLPLDRRTDVWALGVCLHELLAGQRLFTGTSAIEVAKQVCELPVPTVESRRDGLPPGLAKVVSQALERPLVKRFQTAEALRQALLPYASEVSTAGLAEAMRGLFGTARAEERLARSRPQPVRTTLPATESLRAPGPAPTHERPTWPWAAAAALLVSGLGASWWLLPSPPPPSPPAPVVLAPGPPEPPLLLDAAVALVEPAPPPTPVTSAPPPVEKRTPTPGLLSVTANANVSVSLDGRRLGDAPLSRVSVTPGRHQLVVSNAALGLSRTTTIEVRPAKETAERFRFETGELNVNVEPWAEVWIDGTKVGVTPLAGHRLLEGRHRVRLVSPKGEKTVSVTVAPGQSIAVRERLP